MAIASEYPDVELSHMYGDNAAMQLVRNPKQVGFMCTRNNSKCSLLSSFH